MRGGRHPHRKSLALTLQVLREGSKARTCWWSRPWWTRFRRGRRLRWRRTESGARGSRLSRLGENRRRPAKPCGRLWQARDGLLPAAYEALEDGALQAQAQELMARFGAPGALLLRGQTRLDGFFLHSLFGGLAFFALMAVLFQSIFTWAAPAMDGIEAALAWGADGLVPLLPGTLLQDFVADALFGGVGAFLVFVPQIFVLTVIVGIMEDSGYMARAAVICHRPLRFFGLTGKSFVPMLSGVACAIPGIYAARVVESPRKRWLTYLAVPLMPARRACPSTRS